MIATAASVSIQQSPFFVMEQESTGHSIGTVWGVQDFVEIPSSFFEGLNDCESGRVVDMDTALNTEPSF